MFIAKKYSTFNEFIFFSEYSVLLTVHDLATGLRDKQQIDAILLDFSKAFDRVPHERLLLKLNFYG